MRAFVAVNLPDDVRAGLYAALAPLRTRTESVRWIRPDALHITLQFLGWIEDPRVEDVRAALAAAAAGHDAFALRIAGFGAFPSLRRGRVWWLGVESAPLLALQGAVAGALQRIGFEPEDRRFHPHVTVARAPRDVRRQDSAALAETAPGIAWRTDVEVSSVELMQSHLARSGARYEAVASLPLAGC